MDKDKKVGTPPVDPQTAAERFAALQTGGPAAVRGRFDDGRPHLLWHEVVGTERDRDPCGRFAYVAEKLIAEVRMRERTLQAMREIRNRCFERDGKHYYRVERRSEIDPRRLAEAHQQVDGVGTLALASMKELVPQPPWMSADAWKAAFSRYVDVMTRKDDRAPIPRRDELGRLFDLVPNRHFEEFIMPARGVLTGHLVHEPLMGDLAELLALVGAYGAMNWQERFDRAADYLMEAARTPPLIVAKEDGGFHLIHVCLD
ncbi:MAG TPA: hypothetical protein VJ694_03605 [Patescibacteria group bacterium]|nr:hypothetical protein [Patescibacteria group bacterium]